MTVQRRDLLNRGVGVRKERVKVDSKVTPRRCLQWNLSIEMPRRITDSPTAWASAVAHRLKNLPASAGDTGSIPGLGRSLEEANDNRLQYSFWENPMDRGAWWTTVHEVRKRGARRSEQQRLPLPSACMSPPSSSPRPISQMQLRKVQAEFPGLQASGLLPGSKAL